MNNLLHIIPIINLFIYFAQFYSKFLLCSRKIKFIFFLCFQIFLLISNNTCFAFEIIVPESVCKDELLLVEIILHKTDKDVIKIIYNPLELQFVGTVFPIHNIKLEGDNTIAILPLAENEYSNFKFALKFIPNFGVEVTSLTIKNSTSEVNKKISIIEREEKSNKLYYSIILLFFAVVSVIIGYKIWRYQKRKVTLMSTRSLLLNLADLEKLKKELKLEQNISQSNELDNLCTGKNNNNKKIAEDNVPEKANSNTKLSNSSKITDSYQQIIYIELLDEYNNLYKGIASEIFIGRNESNTICIPRAEISRIHAKITFDGSKFLIYKVAQNSKLFVNGIIVELYAEVRKNYMIKLNDYQLKLIELYIKPKNF